jgi:hypothetical protein
LAWWEAGGRSRSESAPSLIAARPGSASERAAAIFAVCTEVGESGERKEGGGWGRGGEVATATEKDGSPRLALRWMEAARDSGEGRDSALAAMGRMG